MNTKQRKTLEQIFERPERADIAWSNLESLFLALGAEISEGSGSRIRVHLRGVRAVVSSSSSRPCDGQGRSEVGTEISPGSWDHAMMDYKGYIGVVEYDDDAGLFHGEVINIRDVVTFQGETVKQLRKAFHDSVNDYLAYCEERGETPDKPYSGRFVVRVEPELHKAIATHARLAKKSLNNWVRETLQRATDGAEKSN